MSSVNTKPALAGSMMTPGRLLRILLSYVRPYSGRAGVLVLTLLLEGAFNILLALSLKLIIDYAIIPRNARVLTFILAGLGGGFLLTAASHVLRDYLYAWFGAGILNDLRREMFRHLQQLSLAFYSRMRAGDVAARFSGKVVEIIQSPRSGRQSNDYELYSHRQSPAPRAPEDFFGLRSWGSASLHPSKVRGDCGRVVNLKNLGPLLK